MIHDEVIITVGALVADNAIVAAGKIDNAQAMGFRIDTMKYIMSYTGKTDGEGPLRFGFNVGLTADEVEEALAADPQHMEDIPAVERANRKVYPLEMIPLDDTESSRIGDYSYKEVKMPWKEIPENIGINWFVWSTSTLTTGMFVHVHIVYTGRWLED